VGKAGDVATLAGHLLLQESYSKIRPYGRRKLKCQVEYYKSDGKQVVEEGKKPPALRWKVRSFF